MWLMRPGLVASQWSKEVLRLHEITLPKCKDDSKHCWNHPNSGISISPNDDSTIYRKTRDWTESFWLNLGTSHSTKTSTDTDGFAACHLAWAAWAKEHNATALKMNLKKLGNWTQSSMFDPRQKQRTFALNFKQLLHSCHWKINIIRRTRVGHTQTGHLRNVSLCHVRCAWNRKQFELSAMHAKAACFLNGFAGRGLGPV